MKQSRPDHKKQKTSKKHSGKKFYKQPVKKSRSFLVDHHDKNQSDILNGIISINSRGVGYVRALTAKAKTDADFI